MKKNKYAGGNSMNTQDRALIVETLGEMRQLKGEMKEFKEHVIGRVFRLEKKKVKGAKSEFQFSA